MGSLPIRLAVGLLAALLLVASAAAQEKQGPPLRVSGMLGGGVRATLTESWGKLDFDIANPAATDRRARVLAFYANEPNVQYGRDLWVPAGALLRSWLPLGPAPAQDFTHSRELRLLLYDLTGGTEQLVLPATDERERPFGVIYRRRDPTVVVLANDALDEGPMAGRLPRPESPADEDVTLARVIRAARGLSAQVQFARPAALPSWTKLFDGVDQVIIASDEIAHNTTGMRALRRWVEHGGSAWVMLDQVEPATAAALLGEALDFHVVGRVSLTDFRVDEPLAESAPQQHERPVTLTRVVLPPGETVMTTVNGWPAWFIREVGRGKVLFTTLGPRAWHRPRTADDPRSPYGDYLALPIARDALLLLVEAARSAQTEAYPAEAFRDMLAHDIGYEVIGRGTVAGVFMLFLTGTLGVVALARRHGRAQAAGWLAPAGSLAAAALLFALGQWSREAAPPAIALVQVVHTVDGSAEAPAHGLLAVFRPDSGPTKLGANDGGFFDLDTAGLEGTTRRLIMTDMDAWHWENLALPAGVRFAPLEYTAPSTEPITATAHFGADGVEGKLTAGPFRNPVDGVLTAAPARKLALELHADGTFRAGPGAALAPAQFVTGTFLSDRQQQRQAVYRRILKPAAAPTAYVRPMLLAWTDPAEVPLALPAAARVAGTALLGVPLRLERGPPGTRVTIPGMFVPVRRVLEGKQALVPYEGSLPATLDLRFQLPDVVLPFAPERARLVAKISARARRITVASPTDGGFVQHLQVESPLGPIRVDIGTERLLRPDQGGGIHLRLTIGELQRRAEPGRPNVDDDQAWAMEYVELEVIGRTDPAP